MELIIVDNKSTDNTKINRLYNNRKISLYEIDNKGIIAKSRNFGIENFSEYLCFLDSDDWWDKDKLKYVNHS